jgi:threonine/homoserine/homoserine lactone efflux protein
MPEPHTFLLFAGAGILVLIAPGPSVLYAAAAGTVGRRLCNARFESRLRRASGVVFVGLGVSAALAEGRTGRA